MILDSDQDILNRYKDEAPVTDDMLILLGFTEVPNSAEYCQSFRLVNETYGDVLFNKYTAADNSVVAKHLPTYDHCYTYSRRKSRNVIVHNHTQENTQTVGCTIYNVGQLFKCLEQIKRLRSFEKKTNEELKEIYDQIRNINFKESKD